MEKLETTPSISRAVKTRDSMETVRARVAQLGLSHGPDTSERDFYHGAPRADQTCTIDGKVCVVRAIRNVQKVGSHRRHAFIGVSARPLRKAAFVIFHVASKGYEERMYVVPVKALEEQLDRVNRRRMQLTIPLSARASKQVPVFDWEAHRDAWHLLKQSS